MAQYDIILGWGCCRLGRLSVDGFVLHLPLALTYMCCWTQVQRSSLSLITFILLDLVQLFSAYQDLFWFWFCIHYAFKFTVNQKLNIFANYIFNEKSLMEKTTKSCKSPAAYHFLVWHKFIHFGYSNLFAPLCTTKHRGRPY